MKRLMLLISTLMMSCISFSQDLTPKITDIEGQAHFAFSMEQTREIAKLLEMGKFHKKLVGTLSKKVNNYKLITAQQDSLIALKSNQIGNYKSLLDNKGRKLQLLKEQIKIRDKRIKKQKRQKVFAVIGMVVLGVLAISK